MKTLKLNQLSKQKVAESEMNAIKGGLPISATYGTEVYGACGERCNGSPSVYTSEGFARGLSNLNY